MSLAGIRKEYWNSDSFRMVLKEAVLSRPEVRPYMPFDQGRTVEQQTNEWLSQSAEQVGFDKCFKLITGRNPEELK